MITRTQLLLVAAVTSATFTVSVAWAAPAQQAYLKASNTGSSDFFGQSVAISGDTMVIGAHQEASNAIGPEGDQNDNSAIFAGAAYVFVRDSSGTWSQQAYLKASNTGARDVFGWSVAVSGDTIVVGAIGEASNATGVNGDASNNSSSQAGAVYVFVREGTQWSQQAYLKASNTGRSDQFGYSVAISGDILLVGARFESSSATGVDGDQADNGANGSGAAYVFVRTGTEWYQEAYLKASNTEQGDVFGWSVGLSGDIAVIGAPYEDSSSAGVDANGRDNLAQQAGAAYVFVRDGSTGIWTQQAYLKASNPDRDDFFGYSVAISGETVVVGAYQESSSAIGVNGNQNDNSATNSGAAYVFVRQATTWSQQAYLKASNTRPAVIFPPPFPPGNSAFGFAVGISGDIVVVGATAEPSAAMGVNANQYDTNAPGSGAAYVFARSGTAWSQQTYLKASNPESSDLFGFTVAVSADTAVLGAVREASSATGVDGNQADNSAPDSGAAYVFNGLAADACGNLVPRLELLSEGASAYLIRAAAVPGCSCRLQRAPRVTGPWDTIAILAAPASGQFEYRDTSPLPGQAFYRTIRP